MGLDWQQCLKAKTVMKEPATFEEALAIAHTLPLPDKLRLMQEMMATLANDLALPQTKSPKPSLLGLWSGVAVSAEDIDEARADMMRNFPREDI